MRKGFDDTGVREGGLQRNPVYRSLSSIEFALSIMFLIGIGTLLGALFPQGMDKAFYLARFGERVFHIYDSVGLLSVFRSWWFMLLFVLLLVVLVFCIHARAGERAFRGTRGTMLFETEFSIPTPSEDVVLIFPVLLRSIGFRKTRIITGERRSEITAIRGISPWATSLLLHVSAAVLLFGLAGTYLFSWGCSVCQEKGQVSTIPLRAQETRWTRLTGGVGSGESDSDGDAHLGVTVLEFERRYKPAPACLVVPPRGPSSLPGSIAREQLLVPGEGRDLLLTSWSTSLRLVRGNRVETLRVTTGKSETAFGLRISQGTFLEIASIEFPSVGETLQVVLPASVRLRGVQFSMSPVQVTDLGEVGGLVGSGFAARGMVRVVALPLDEKRGALGEIYERTADLSSGDTATLAGLPVRVLGLSERSVIRVRSDPGCLLVKLGALLLILFSTLRLHMYWYMLRVELAGTKGGGSYLRFRIRASGLFSSPTRVARRIARLLAK